LRAAGSLSWKSLAPADERGGLPVPLCAETIAGRHRSLGGGPREVPQPVEILEGGREGAEPTLLEERAQRDLLARLVPQTLAHLPAPLQRRGERVRLLVFLHLAVDVGVPHLSDATDQIPDAVA